MRCPLLLQLKFDFEKCKECRYFKACKRMYEIKGKRKKKESPPGDNYPSPLFKKPEDEIQINKYYFMKQIEYCIKCEGRSVENCRACSDNPCKRVAEFRETRNLKNHKIIQTDVLDIIIDANLYKGEWIK